MKKSIGIIGGGASGVFSAIQLSKRFDVTIYERQSRILKKVLQSGNGMCNLTNENVSKSDILDIYNTELIKPTLDVFDYNKCIEVFNDLGLIIKKDNEGRCYPYSKKASTVVDILVRGLEENNVKVVCDTNIESIKKSDKFILNNKYEHDYLIVSTGSKSFVGFNYNAYDMIKKLGISLTNIHPSLVGFKTIENIKSLSGLRFKSKVKLLGNDKLIDERIGEVQFKDDGISGIVIMELSRLYDKNKKCSVILDLMNEYSQDSLEDILNKYYKKYNNLEDALKGILPKMLYNDILKRSKSVKDVVYNIKNYKLNIKDTYGFENSQVSRGGVCLDEIDLNTYESRNIKNLYFVGEVLDVDGTCGGYNLHFAWASSYMMAKSLIGCE